jgi:hypothetical protein
MPEGLTGSKSPQYGFYPHRAQDDRVSGTDRGQISCYLPGLIHSAAPKGGGCGGMNASAVVESLSHRITLYVYF